MSLATQVQELRHQMRANNENRFRVLVRKGATESLPTSELAELDQIVSALGKSWKSVEEVITAMTRIAQLEPIVADKTLEKKYEAADKALSEYDAETNAGIAKIVKKHSDAWHDRTNKVLADRKSEDRKVRDKANAVVIVYSNDYGQETPTADYRRTRLDRQAELVEAHNEAHRGFKAWAAARQELWSLRSRYAEFLND